MERINELMYNYKEEKENEILDLQKEISEIENKLLDMKRCIDSSENIIKDLKKQVIELKSESDAKDDLILSLQSEISELKSSKLLEIEKKESVKINNQKNKDIFTNCNDCEYKKYGNCQKNQVICEFKNHIYFKKRK